MAPGSTVQAVKTALTSLLSARPGLTGVKVSYQAPITAKDLVGDAGALEAIWLDVADGGIDIEIVSALPLWLDESYDLDVMIQVLQPKSDGTQEAADARAALLLGEVLAVVSVDPTLGITTFARCEVIPARWKHVTGVLPSGTGHGSRFELKLAVEGRLHLS